MAPVNPARRPGAPGPGHFLFLSFTFLFSLHFAGETIRTCRPRRGFTQFPIFYHLYLDYRCFTYRCVQIQFIYQSSEINVHLFTVYGFWCLFSSPLWVLQEGDQTAWLSRTTSVYACCPTVMINRIPPYTFKSVWIG